MRKKALLGISTTIISIAISIGLKVAEVIEMITKANADNFMIVAGVLFLIGISLLVWAYWPSLRHISLKIHKKDWVTCDKCGFIGVRNIKTRELEEMEDNQRQTGRPILKRTNSLGDTEPRHERIPECIMQAQDFAVSPPLSTNPLPLFHMQFPRQCRHFIKWQKGLTPKEHKELSNLARKTE